MNRSEYIELRAELRAANTVRLIRPNIDPLTKLDQPEINSRVFGVRIRASILQLRTLGGWQTVREGDQVVLHPCTRNEYVITPASTAQEAR